MINKMVLLCKVCDKVLTGKQKKLCSQICKNKYRRKKVKVSYKLICDECNKEFISCRPAKRCSPNCRAKNHYANNKEEIDKRNRDNYAKNPEKYREKSLNNYDNDRDEINEKRKLDRKINPEKHKTWAKNSYDKHKDEINEKRREDYAKNPEKYAIRAKESYGRHSEKIKKKSQKFYDDNKEEINKKDRENYAQNKEEICAKNRDDYAKNPKKYNLRSAKYQKNNKDKVKKQQQVYEKKRNKSDPIFNIMKKYRRSIRRYISKKRKKSIDYIGCTPNEFKIHLESQFTKGMTWELLMQGKIHIDHIIPLASAETPEEVEKLCHYSNLQPLWAKDNMKKGAKMPKQKTQI